MRKLRLPLRSWAGSLSPNPGLPVLSNHHAWKNWLKDKLRWGRLGSAAWEEELPEANWAHCTTAIISTCPRLAALTLQETSPLCIKQAVCVGSQNGKRPHLGMWLLKEEMSLFPFDPSSHSKKWSGDSSCGCLWHTGCLILTWSQLITITNPRHNNATVWLQV